MEQRLYLLLPIRYSRGSSIEPLELRDLAAARIDFHLDAAAGRIASINLPQALVELDLADRDDAVHQRDVARLVDRDERRRDSDRLRLDGRDGKESQYERGERNRVTHDDLLRTLAVTDNVRQRQMVSLGASTGRPILGRELEGRKSEARHDR